MSIIREAITQDQDAIHALHLAAFPEEEGQLVADLAVQLLTESTTPEIISLLAEQGGKTVGHIAFSPVAIKNCQDTLAYILAPLGVAPDCHGSGIGSKLIHHGIERLSRNRVHILFVYGDPGYYGRFGFETELASSFVPPYPLQYPVGWQALMLDSNQSPLTATASLTCVTPLLDPALW